MDKNYKTHHVNSDHVDSSGNGVSTDTYVFILEKYNIILRIQRFYRNGKIIGFTDELNGYHHLLRHDDIHREIDQIIEDMEETIEDHIV